VNKPRIGIIIGSIRPGRKGEVIANWVFEIASRRTDAAFEIVDLRDYPLPIYNEAVSAMHGALDPTWSMPEYVVPWAEKIRSLDGFIFVTPEYNRSTSSVLKNALDYLYCDWNNKAAGFVGYGGVGGARAVEHLRNMAAELQIATVRGQVPVSTIHDYENFTDFSPSPFLPRMIDGMLDQLVAWSNALIPLRAAAGTFEPAGVSDDDR
jgi:NAD(P)H-dependent FMN reductase